MKPIIILPIIIVFVIGIVFSLSLTPDEDNAEITQMEGNCLGDAGCFSGIVTEVIDGDTIKVDGQSIRFALVDAPKIKYDGGKARSFIQELCPVGSTVIVDQDDSQLEDKFGRMLGVIHCNDLNLNKELLDSGLGDLYSAFCDQSEFSTQSWAQKHGCETDVTKPDENQIQTPKEGQTYTQPQEKPRTDCEPSYPSVCIPMYPPDLDCDDIPVSYFKVEGDDPHRFDGDDDGVGCEK